jgi:hypothetical protein
MTQEVKLRVKGLYDNPNPYSAVPAGALATADNVNVDREDLATPRRGFVTSAISPASPFSSAVSALTEYTDATSSWLLAHYGSKLAYNSTGSTWSEYTGSFADIAACTMRFIQLSQNLYFTTSAGLYRLDSAAGTPVMAGSPRAINFSVTKGTGTNLIQGNQYAHRVVWGFKDANQNLHLGAPSERVITIVTTSGATDYKATLRVYIPAGITTSYFVQVYRSTGSGVDTATPTDDLYLTYETNPTGPATTPGTDLYKGYIDIDDVTPDELLGATLYTSSSQEGILGSNDRPPLAEDIATFKGYTFYANTQTLQRGTMTLLGANAAAGLSDGNTVTIAGVTYIAKTTLSSGPAVPEEFLIAYTGSGSPALSASQAIEASAQSLIAKINSYAGNTTVYAYYLSGPDDLPGLIRIEARSLATAAFSMASNKATAWTFSGASSTNDDFQNGLFWSKALQPEAVPLTNCVRVGSANSPIQRIIALRDSLFVLKTEGIYRLYGTDPGNFQVDLFDSSAKLIAKESAVVLNNTIFAYMDQGVCTISETGVQVKSLPIQQTLLKLQGAILSDIKTYCWALAYESDRRYILHLPVTGSDDKTTQAYCYNTFTNAWTRWVVSHRCGLVRPSVDLMHVGSAAANTILSERKAYNFTDIADDSFSVTVLSATGTSVTVSDTSGISVGDVLYESNSVFAQVGAIDRVTGVLTMNQNSGFSATGGSYTHLILQGYTCTVKWQPFFGDAPTLLKQYREISLLFNKAFTIGQIQFTSDLARATSTVDVTGSFVGLWGLFKWGMVPWGGGIGSQLIRTYVPRPQQRSCQLNVTFEQTAGYNDFELAGVQLVYNQIGEKSTRDS